MNIAYASTRGWNVGDDFIRMGCERILEAVYPRHNRILYDKSEHVRRGDGRPWEQGEFHGNSLERKAPIDLMVFAGTPANQGRVTERAFDYGAPVLALALGSNPNALSRSAIEHWSRAKIVTTRCKEYLQDWRRLVGDRVLYLPCTSLFAFDSEKEVDGLHRVALGWRCRNADTCSHNGMSDAQYHRMVQLYHDLMKARPNLDYVIVCHHIDELRDAVTEFPDFEIRHSYNEHDYSRIYGDCDFTISPRVHGIGASASLCIGGVLLPTDDRKGTVEGFLAGYTWDFDEILRQMDGCVAKSRALSAHKAIVFGDYIKEVTA